MDVDLAIASFVVEVEVEVEMAVEVEAGVWASGETRTTGLPVAEVLGEVGSDNEAVDLRPEAVETCVITGKVVAGVEVRVVAGPFVTAKGKKIHIEHSKLKQFQYKH